MLNKSFHLLNLQNAMIKKQNKNFLLEMHQQLFALSREFREKICAECNWSEATYYRKAKKNVNSISKAEKEKIITIANDLLHGALTGSNKL